MLRILIILLFIFTNLGSLYPEYNDASTDLIKYIPDFLKPAKDKINVIYNISNQTNVTLNSNLDLLYNYPADRFYPADNLIIQINSFFPITKEFSLGPSFFNDSYFKIYKNETQYNQAMLNINSIFLTGLGFNFTPYHPKLKIPMMMFLLDFGLSCEINNNENDGDGLRAKLGGYSIQMAVLPINPAHLFIMDVNIFSIMATLTPAGYFPGLVDRNILLIKFKFTDFIDKKIGIGLRLKNNFNFTLTGKPSMTDLSSQYTYDRLETTLYYSGIKNIEFHSGYGFEYITFARETEYYLAHKVINEIAWKISAFKLSIIHHLLFWDNSLKLMFPANKFELSLVFSNMDI